MPAPRKLDRDIWDGVVRMYLDRLEQHGVQAGGADRWARCWTSTCGNAGQGCLAVVSQAAGS